MKNINGAAPLSASAQRRLLTLPWMHLSLLCEGAFDTQYVFTLLGQFNVCSALASRRRNAEVLAVVTRGQDVLVDLLKRKVCPSEAEVQVLSCAMHEVDRYFRTVPKKALVEAIAYVDRCIAQGKGEVVR